MIEEIIRRLAGEWSEPVREAGVSLMEPLSIMVFGTPEDRLGKAITFVYSAGKTQPSLVLKIARTPEYQPWIDLEQRILKGLSDIDRIQGTIPKPIGVFRLGNEKVAVETVVPGIKLSVLLNRWKHIRANQVQANINRVRDWLIDLKLATRIGFESFPGSSAIEERYALLEPHFTDLGINNLNLGDVLALADDYNGLDLPLAAEHGDLWPNNCFIDRDRIGVIDWEDFSQDNPPLYDLFFFLTTFSLSYPWSKLRRNSRQDAFIKAVLNENWFSSIIFGCVESFFASFNIPAKAAQPFYLLFLMDAAQHYVGWNLGKDNIWLSLIPLFVENQGLSIFSRPKM